MSEGSDESVTENEPISDNDGAIDQDVMFGEDDGGDDALDRGYSPPERPRELDAFGTTPAEQRQGETFEQRLAQEEPDPAQEVDLVEGEPPVRAGEGGDVLDDGEVGDARAGRLVSPGGGIGEDVEKDLVARDVGIDGGAASAEEAAVHVVDGGQPAGDEGSSR